MDSHSVKITVTTRSINGHQNEAEIDALVEKIVKLASNSLSDSRVEVEVEKHRRLVHQG